MPAQEPTADSKLRQQFEAVLEPVPKQQRSQLVERILTITRSEKFSGPLPHPKHLAGYEACSPGLALRIVGMAEYAQKKSEERMDVAVSREYNERSLGLKLGFYALCAMLVTGTIIVLAGNQMIGGGLLGFAVLSGVVGLFVHGRAALRPNPQTEDHRKKVEQSKAAMPHSKS